nr:hypothetical protein BaRGS_026884 [Batillaria attramentaria]
MGDNSNCGKPDKHAIVISVASVCFTLLSLPNNILQAVTQHHPSLLRQNYYLYKTLDQSFMLAQDLSRFTSFFTFFILSEDFRRKCIKLLCPWRKRNSTVTSERLKPLELVVYSSRKSSTQSESEDNSQRTVMSRVSLAVISVSEGESG